MIVRMDGFTQRCNGEACLLWLQEKECDCKQNKCKVLLVWWYAVMLMHHVLALKEEN